jgi:hypothetical protein
VLGLARARAEGHVSRRRRPGITPRAVRDVQRPGQELQTRGRRWCAANSSALAFLAVGGRRQATRWTRVQAAGARRASYLTAGFDPSDPQTLQAVKGRHELRRDLRPSTYLNGVRRDGAARRRREARKDVPKGVDPRDRASSSTARTSTQITTRQASQEGRPRPDRAPRPRRSSRTSGRTPARTAMPADHAPIRGRRPRRHARRRGRRQAVRRRRRAARRGPVLRPGEVHALLGENGPASRRWSRCLTGLEQPDAGTVRLGGSAVTWRGRSRRGTAASRPVSQELEPVPGPRRAGEPVSASAPRRAAGSWTGRAMRDAAAPHLAALGLDVDPRTLLGELTLAQQQLVEIAPGPARRTRGFPRARRARRPRSGPAATESAARDRARDPPVAESPSSTCRTSCRRCA